VGEGAVLTRSAGAATRWLRQRLKSGGEERPVHPGFEATGAPGDARARTYGNWAKVIRDGYGFALKLSPLLETLGELAPSLDVDSLPAPEVLTRYFGPGTSWVRTWPLSPETVAWQYDAKTTFGPGSWVVLPGMAAAIIAPSLFNKFGEAQETLAQAELKRMSFLIEDSFFEHGEFPERLGDLATGDDPLLDPWGSPYRYERSSAFAYRLWSKGPNRRDENGEGDDLLVVGG